MIEILASFSFFIIGSIIGSFLNVCIYRIPQGKSIIFPRSHCPQCSASIRWWCNIPLFSFIALRGRCQHCGGFISFRYPLVELITASLFMTTYLFFGVSMITIVYMILIASLIVVGFIDWDNRIIPNWITLPGILVGWGLSLAIHEVHLWDSFLGTIGGGGLLFFIGILGKLIFKKESMGGGDVKLASMIGSFLGWKQVAIILFFSFLIGAIGGTFLLLANKSFVKNRQIPFGPFISLATIIMIFYGESIVNFYLGLLESK